MNMGYINISGSRVTYSVLWNPETTYDRPVNSPESTSFVNVNYQKSTTGKEVYTVTPLPNCATRANNFTCADGDVRRVIAGLEAADSKGTKTSAGQYEVPFTLVIRAN